MVRPSCRPDLEPPRRPRRLSIAGTCLVSRVTARPPPTPPPQSKARSRSPRSDRDKGSWQIAVPRETWLIRAEAQDSGFELRSFKEMLLRVAFRMTQRNAKPVADPPQYPRL